jgi:hopanoid-associated phosphorylase
VSRLGVITGLAREADCFGALPKQDTLPVRCAGGCSKRAREIARILVSEGCRGLVSFGIAGGLEPSLNPGALVIAASVIGPDGSRTECDSKWRRRLTNGLGSELSVVESDVFGSDQAVLLSREKRRLHEETGAIAVDMESHVVAQIAAAHGVSFLAVRAIADPVSRDIPSWVPGLVGLDGRPRARAVIAGMVAHPLQLPVLISLGMDSEKAFRTLRRVALSGRPLLQFSA